MDDLAQASWIAHLGENPLDDDSDKRLPARDEDNFGL
jgi:hypothetical protein